MKPSPRNVLIALSLLALSAPLALAGPVQVQQVSLKQESPKRLVLRATLRYTGTEASRSRLIEGRFLKITSIGTTFMDSDWVIDDQMRAVANFTEEWTPALGSAASKSYLWDVTSNPEVTYRRTYNVHQHLFTSMANGRYRHEVLAGEESLRGQVHRAEVPSPESMRGLGDAIRYVTYAAMGISPQRGVASPDLFNSDPEVYVVTDLRYQDGIGLRYRLIAETEPLTLPRYPGGFGPDEPSSSLGASVEPSFFGLTQ